MLALFVFSGYYPSGGWNDFVGTYGTEEVTRVELARLEATEEYDYWQLVNLTTLVIEDSGGFYSCPTCHCKRSYCESELAAEDKSKHSNTRARHGVCVCAGCKGA